MKIGGTIQNLKIEASGASDIKNYDLVVDNCIARLSGASDVKITVNNSISARASGASTLNYKGTAERRDISSSGASNISKEIKLLICPSAHIKNSGKTCLHES